MIASAKAVQPPMAWTTPDPAKSTAPCPQCIELPSLAIQPPPHSQLP